MKNPDAPHCLGKQVRKYSQVTPGMDPHVSSGPPNLAFYTACGELGGKSWERIGQVWYKVLISSGRRPKMRMKVFANRTREEASIKVTIRLLPFTVQLIKGWNSVGL